MAKINLKHYKEKITDKDIIYVMSILGCHEYTINKDCIIFPTVCHNENGFGKHKLYYYKNSQTFYCYTKCGTIGDIFSLVQKKLNCNFVHSLNFVKSLLKIEATTKDDSSNELYFVENDFTKKFKKKSIAKINTSLEELVLNDYWKLYHKSWIDDYIAIDILEKFNIRFDISNYRVIIPIYDENCKLVSVKCRNLSNEDVVNFGKYGILTKNGKTYNYNKAKILYGLGQNLKNIKKTKEVIIGEAEKFVLQHGSYYEDSNAVALCGSSLSDEQIKLLLRFNVERVVIALDKEFQNDDEAIKYGEKIKKNFVQRLIPYFHVSVIFDTCNCLDYKMSATDKGKEVFEYLYNNRFIFT